MRKGGEGYWGGDGRPGEVDTEFLEFVERLEKGRRMFWKKEIRVL